MPCVARRLLIRKHINRARRNSYCGLRHPFNWYILFLLSSKSIELNGLLLFPPLVNMCQYTRTHTLPFNISSSELAVLLADFCFRYFTCRLQSLEGRGHWTLCSTSCACKEFHLLFATTPACITQYKVFYHFYMYYVAHLSCWYIDFHCRHVFIEKVFQSGEHSMNLHNKRLLAFLFS